MKQLLFAGILLSLFMGQAHAENFPLMIPYSGTISSEGELFEGAGEFKFAIVNKSCAFSDTPDQCITYWSNDGTSNKGSEPDKSIKLTVQGGRFQTKLGDTRFTAMTTIPTTVFDNDETFLRVWFNDGIIGFQQLDNDRQLVSAPYAYRALTADHVTIDNITSEQITDGTIGLNDIDSSQIQVRINGTGCSEGSAIRKIDQDGSIVCAKDEGVLYKSGTGIAIVENEIHILQESIGLSHLKFDPVTQEEMDQSAGVGISIQDRKISIAENGITQAHLNFDPATQSELNVVQQATIPVGGIIDWWRPDNSFNVPTGFKVCDGSAITEKNSPYYNQATPNLIGRFTLGVQGHEIGNSGGKTTHSHSTDINHDHAAVESAKDGTHSHNYDISHDHPNTYTTTTGDHNHVSLKFVSGQFQDGIGNPQRTGHPDNDLLGTEYATLSPSKNTNFGTSVNGAHGHHLDLPPYELTKTSGKHTGHLHSVDIAPLGEKAITSSEINHLPPYVGMLKIMRIY